MKTTIALIAASLLLIFSANSSAAIIIDIMESAGNVEATVSGSLDLSATFYDTHSPATL